MIITSIGLLKSKIKKFSGTCISAKL